MGYKVQRYYRISMTLGPLSYYENTRVYTLNAGVQPKLLGLFFVLMNILTGFGGLLNKLGAGSTGIDNTLEAIRINITGGIDITDITESEDHDDRSVYVYNHLPVQTYYKVEMDDLLIILELHDAYIAKNPHEKYSDSNAEFILWGLSRIDINHLEYDDVTGIFEVLNDFEEQDFDLCMPS